MQVKKKRELVSEMEVEKHELNWSCVESCQRRAVVTLKERVKRGCSLLLSYR